MKQSRLRSPSRLQPTPRTHHSHHQQRAQNLHLPSLPRFHPAQFQHVPLSSDSSASGSPSSGLNSPQVPLSPRQQHRMYSEAQRQLYTFQRDMMSRGMHLESDLGTRAVHRSPKPASPRLQPLGSPGPVTPFELEEEQQERYSGNTDGSYFHQHNSGMTDDKNDHSLESFFQKDGHHALTSGSASVLPKPYSTSPLGLSAR